VRAKTALFAALLLATILFIVPASVPHASALQPHAPILIQGDAAFVAANGVVSGAGTAANPFVIAGWEISPSANPAVQVRDTTTHFVIRDLVASHAYTGCAVSLLNVTHATVQNATLTSGGDPLCAGSARDVVFRGNTLSVGGINVEASDGVVASDNLVVDGNLGVWRSANVTVQGNRIVRGGVNVGWSSNATVRGNSVEDPDTYGIWLPSVTNATVAANVVSNGTQTGILVGSSEGVVIDGNEIAGGPTDGVSLHYTANATVRANRFTDDGLAFYGDAPEHFLGPTVEADNLVNGLPLAFYRDCSGLVVDGVALGQLFVVNCTSVRVRNLSISRTGTAINLYYVTDATVEANTMTANGGGMSAYASVAVNITRNDLWDNAIGVVVSSSQNVSVFHNNLVRNGYPWQALDYGGAGNRWDDGYPSGGNYWSSYEGADLCGGPNQDVCPGSDGIGDQRVTIGGVNDRYPLMLPFGRPSEAPMASFVFSPPTPFTGDTIWFDASSSFDPDGSVRKYEWDFGDGTGPSQSSSYRPHWYASRGTYLVTLRVTDNSGLIGTTSQTVRVMQLPVASFTWTPQYPFLDQTMTFNASASNDPEGGQIVSYAWDFGDGTTETGVVVTHVYRTFYGGMRVRLVVTSDSGLSGEHTEYFSMGYDPAPPVSSAVYTGARGENGWFKTGVTAELRATDEGSWVSRISYRVDGGRWEEYDLPLNFTDGDHIFEYYAVDGADTAESVHRDPVRVDTRAPVFTLAQSSEGSEGSAITVAWAAVDEGSGIARYEVSVDNGSYGWVGLNESVSVTLPSGEHTVSVRAVDRAGNAALAAIAFTVRGGEVPQRTADLTVWLAAGVGAMTGVAVAAVLLALRRRKPPAGTKGARTDVPPR
jgi:parallel beta-helix repeat protein